MSNLPRSLFFLLFLFMGYCLEGSNHCIVGEWAWELWDVSNGYIAVVACFVFFSLIPTDLYASVVGHWGYRAFSYLSSI
jgi:hypothetical protein